MCVCVCVFIINNEYYTTTYARVSLVFVSSSSLRRSTLLSLSLSLSLISLTQHILSQKNFVSLDSPHSKIRNRCDMEEEAESLEKSNDESKIKVWVRIRPPIRQSSQVSLRSHENSIKIKKKTYTYVVFFSRQRFVFFFPKP